MLISLVALQVGMAAPSVTVRPSGKAVTQAAKPASGQAVTPPMSTQPLHSYIRQEDYPAAARRAGEQGTVAFRLRVGEDGRPQDCTIDGSPKLPILEPATCALMLTRPQFTPARDAAGKAVAGTIRAKVRWSLQPGAATQVMALAEHQVFRHRLVAEQMRDCRGERTIGGQTMRVDARDCRGLKLPPPILSAIRELSTRSDPSVRIEQRLLTDSSKPWPDTTTLAGKLIAQSFVRLVVEEGGRVSSCTLLDAMPIGGLPMTPCKIALSVAAKGLSLPAELRLVMTIHMEDEPAGTAGDGTTGAARP